MKTLCVKPLSISGLSVTVPKAPSDAAWVRPPSFLPQMITGHSQLMSVTLVFICVPLSITSPQEGRGGLHLLTACTHHVAQRLVCNKVTRIFLPSYSLATLSSLGFYYLMVFSLHPPYTSANVCACTHTHAHSHIH